MLYIIIILYSFAVLCKICKPSLSSSGHGSSPLSVDLQNVDVLEETTAKMCRFVLEFFVQPAAAPADGTRTSLPKLRPLTNSNFIIDFWRFKQAPYFDTMTHYLQHSLTKSMFDDNDDDSDDSTAIPEYPQQYREVLRYFRTQKILHKYGKFTLEGHMSSTPNTKSLQNVSGTDDAARKLARSDYYKYRPANLMFGFNAGIMGSLEAFCEFNSLRKNQLLRFSDDDSLRPALENAAQALSKAKGATKYRDYCK
jgi:hypothetical protein